MKSPEPIRCRECRTLNEPGSLFCNRCGSSLEGPAYARNPYRRSRITAGGIAMGLALFLLLLAATFVLGVIVYRTVRAEEHVEPLAGRPGTTASTNVAPTGGSPSETAGPSTTLAAMIVRPRAASASSALKATSITNYGPTNLLDGDLATAWNEGAEGPGVGEWVRFEFSQPVVLARLEVANGYQKDDERFFGNIRVKTFKLEYSNGATQLVDLLDIKDFQVVNTIRRSTEWIKLTIMSVYPDYEWEDAALSEVRIYELVERQ